MLEAKNPLAPVMPITESAKILKDLEVEEAIPLISLFTTGEDKERYFISYLLIDFAC